MKKQLLKRHKGFILLFTMVLSAILLAIAIGASDIAVKELMFSTSARNSNDAFFAADQGADCALYFDKLSINHFPLSGTQGPVSCANGVANNGSGDGTNANYSFSIAGLGSLGSGCSQVYVSKVVDSTNTLKTTITSYGYSPSGLDTSKNPSCITGSSTVNRKMTVGYTNY
jgi:hypothetical protein